MSTVLTNLSFGDIRSAVTMTVPTATKRPITTTTTTITHLQRTKTILTFFTIILIIIIIIIVIQRRELINIQQQQQQRHQHQHEQQPREKKKTITDTTSRLAHKHRLTSLLEQQSDALNHRVSTLGASAAFAPSTGLATNQNNHRFIPLYALAWIIFAVP